MRPPTLQSSRGANLLFTVVLLATLAAKSGYVQSLEITSINMAPTLWAGDRVVVHDLGYAPEVGQVVAYHSPFGRERPQWGRIVAGAGQSVELSEAGLFVDGVPAGKRPPVPSNCESGDAAACAVGGESTPPGEDPETDLGRDDPCREGRCLMLAETLGDHRYLARQAGSYQELLFGPREVPEGYVFVLSDNRVDDRDSRIYGAIPVSAIVGIAAFVYYAQDETGVRWDRISRRVS